MGPWHEALLLAELGRVGAEGRGIQIRGQREEVAEDQMMRTMMMALR